MWVTIVNNETAQFYEIHISGKGVKTKFFVSKTNTIPSLTKYFLGCKDVANVEVSVL